MLASRYCYKLSRLLWFKIVLETVSLKPEVPRAEPIPFSFFNFQEATYIFCTVALQLGEPLVSAPHIPFSSPLWPFITLPPLYKGTFHCIQHPARQSKIIFPSQLPYYKVSLFIHSQFLGFKAQLSSQQTAQCLEEYLTRSS